jgi:hypothetical protein
LAETAVPRPATGVTRFTIDQENRRYHGALWSLSQLAPVGQEFRPERPSLGVVVLWTEGGGTQEPAELRVNIREERIDGPILGSSEAVTLGPGFVGRALFLFDTAVPLTPGAIYALEIELVAGENRAVGWVQHAGWDDPYPAGSAISRGKAQPEVDLWFQIGGEGKD